jgi:hypothetical protein
MRKLFPAKGRIKIRSVKTSKAAEGERLYEIEPESYAGPWKLSPGTVLEIVSVPPKEKEKP